MRPLFCRIALLQAMALTWPTGFDFHDHSTLITPPPVSFLSEALSPVEVFQGTASAATTSTRKARKKISQSLTASLIASPEIHALRRKAGAPRTEDEPPPSILNELVEILNDPARTPASVVTPHIDALLREITTTPEVRTQKFDAPTVVVSLAGVQFNLGFPLSGLVSAISSAKAAPGMPRIRVVYDRTNPSEALIMVYQAGGIYFCDTHNRAWSDRIPVEGSMIGVETLYLVDPVDTFIERTLIDHFGRPEIQLAIIDNPPYRRQYNADQGGEIAFDPVHFSLPKTKGTWSFLKRRLFRVDEKGSHLKRYAALVDAQDPENYLFFLSTPNRVILYNRFGPIAAYDKTKSDAELARRNIYLDTFLQDLINTEAPWMRNPARLGAGGGPATVWIGGDSGTMLILYSGKNYQVEAQNSNTFKQLDTFGWSQVRRVLNEQDDVVTRIYRIGKNLLAMEGIGDLLANQRPIYLLYGTPMYVPHMTRRLAKVSLVTERFREAFGEAGRSFVGPSRPGVSFKSTKTFSLVDTRRLVPVRTVSGRWVLRPMIVIVEKGSSWEQIALKHPEQISVPGVGRQVHAVPPAPRSADAIATKPVEGSLAAVPAQHPAPSTADIQRILGPSEQAFQNAKNLFDEGEKALTTGDLAGALRNFERAEMHAHLAIYGGPRKSPTGYLWIIDNDANVEIRKAAAEKTDEAAQILEKIEDRLPETVRTLAARTYRAIDNAEDTALIVAPETLPELRLRAIGRQASALLRNEPALLGHERQIEDLIPTLAAERPVSAHKPEEGPPIPTKAAPRHYQTETGTIPFQNWLKSLKDDLGKDRILKRIERAFEGNLGKHGSVGEGIVELKIDVGPGYRVYLGQFAKELIILCGGDKSTQEKDIRRAHRYWKTLQRSS